MQRSPRSGSAAPTRRKVLGALGKAALIAPAAIAPAALAACQGAGTTPAAPTAESGPVTITMHTRTGPDVDHFTERANAFKKTAPNVTVNLESIAPTEYIAKVTAMQASNSLGDAMWHTQTWVFFPFANSGGVRALDDLAKRDKYDLGQFFPNCIQQLRWKGKLYGLPWLVHTGNSGILVNEDTWQRLGQPLPTWDWSYQREFLDGLQRVGKGVASDAPDRFAMDMPYTLQGAITFIRSWGAEIISEDGKKSVLNTAKPMEALTFIHDLMNVYKVVPRPDQNAANSFVSGKTASSNNAYFALGMLRSQIGSSFKWHAYPMPKGPGGGRDTFLGLDNTSVTAVSKHTDAAWQWTQFLANKETGLKVAADRGSPGARPDVWNDPQLMADANHQMFLTWLKTIKPLPIPANARVADMFDAVATGLAALYLEKKGPPQAIADLHQALQNVLDM